MQYFGALRRTMRAVTLAVRRAGTLVRTLTRKGRGGHVERAAAEAVAVNPLPKHGNLPLAEAFESFKSDMDKRSPETEVGADSSLRRAVRMASVWRSCWQMPAGARDSWGRSALPVCGQAWRLGGWCTAAGSTASCGPTWAHQPKPPNHCQPAPCRCKMKPFSFL